jgi:hypothetical protein
LQAKVLYKALAGWSPAPARETKKGDPLGKLRRSLAAQPNEPPKSSMANLRTLPPGLAFSAASAACSTAGGKAGNLHGLAHGSSDRGARNTADWRTMSSVIRRTGGLRSPATWRRLAVECIGERQRGLREQHAAAKRPTELHGVVEEALKDVLSKMEQEWLARVSRRLRGPPHSNRDGNYGYPTPTSVSPRHHRKLCR